MAGAVTKEGCIIGQNVNIGANTTIVCGVTIGRDAFVSTGAVANRNVPDFADVYGVPARLKGWICYCGVKLPFSTDGNNQTAQCSNCDRKYRKVKNVIEEIK